MPDNEGRFVWPVAPGVKIYYSYQPTETDPVGCDGIYIDGLVEPPAFWRGMFTGGVYVAYAYLATKLFGWLPNGIKARWRDRWITRNRKGKPAG